MYSKVITRVGRALYSGFSSLLPKGYRYLNQQRGAWKKTVRLEFAPLIARVWSYALSGSHLPSNAFEKIVARTITVRSEALSQVSRP